MTSATAHCRGCRARIIFRTSASTGRPMPLDPARARIIFRTSASTGRPMPLDPAPADDGNCRLDGRHVHVLAGLELDAARLAGEQLHRAHHSTCPTEAARRALRQTDTETGMRQGTLL